MFDRAWFLTIALSGALLAQDTVSSGTTSTHEAPAAWTQGPRRRSSLLVTPDGRVYAWIDGKSGRQTRLPVDDFSVEQVLPVPAGEGVVILGRKKGARSWPSEIWFYDPILDNSWRVLAGQDARRLIEKAVEGSPKTLDVDALRNIEGLAFDAENRLHLTTVGGCTFRVTFLEDGDLSITQQTEIAGARYGARTQGSLHERDGYVVEPTKE